MRLSRARALDRHERDMRRRGLSPETIAKNLYAVRTFVASTDVAVRRLRRAHVESYLARLHARGVAAATQARALGAVRMFVRFLVDDGVLAEDVTERLRVGGQPSGPRHTPSEVAVARMLAAADVPPRSGSSTELALRDRALLELLYGLGLRSAEARAARVADLNLADGTLQVRAAKRGPARTLPLPRAALPHLRRYLEEARPRLARGAADAGHLLLTRTGGPFRDSSAVRNVVARVARRAGLRCHPHALRRALATHLVAAGLNLRAVQILLGHADLEATQRYVVVDRAELRRAVSALDFSKA